MLIQLKTIIVVLSAILLGVSTLAFMADDARYVAAPGFACVVMLLWLWMTLWERDEMIPFFDVGVFCAMATFVYTIYPLVNYWVDGFQFGFLSDGRLQQYDISPEALGFFHLRHVLYLFSFVAVYVLFRGRGTVTTGNVSAPDSATEKVIFSFVMLLMGYFIVLQLLTGINYNASYESDVFKENVDAFRNAPLLLVQISSKLGGVLFIFKLALLFIIINRCRQKKWFIILLVWIAAEIIQTLILKGSRTGLIMFLMATALLYHRMIKPLSIKFLITSGTLIFLFFIFMGLYRSYSDIASLQNDLSQADAGMFSGVNEFQALLGTAYDVMQRKEAGAYLPWYLYINDFITILPPQQLIPFEKVAASEWYLREINMSGIGIGFMWGVITQSIIGFDWIELALRGGILGFILALIHRWYLKHKSEFLATLLYLYLCLKVYYTFRDTTFSLLANLVWEVIPFYILLRIGVAILSVKVGDQPGRRMAIISQNIK